MSDKILAYHRIEYRSGSQSKTSETTHTISPVFRCDAFVIDDWFKMADYRGISVLWSVYVFTFKCKPVAWFKKHAIVSVTFTLAKVFLLAVGVRVFIIEIYTIPSVSMENTLVQGDKVLVSKLNYDPKLPLSPLDVPWEITAINRTIPGAGALSRKKISSERLS